MSTFPVEMDLEILEKLSTKELLPVRTTSKYNRMMVDDIIRRRHKAKYGPSDKSAAAKIKDMMLQPALDTLYNVRHREWPVLDEISATYFSELFAGQGPPSYPGFLVPRKTTTESFVLPDDEADEMFPSNREFLDYRDSLLDTFPQFKVSIMHNYYALLAYAGVAVHYFRNNDPLFQMALYDQIAANPDHIPDIKNMRKWQQTVSDYYGFYTVARPGVAGVHYNAPDNIRRGTIENSLRTLLLGDMEYIFSDPNDGSILQPVDVKARLSRYIHDAARPAITNNPLTDDQRAILYEYGAYKTDRAVSRILTRCLTQRD